MADGTGTELVAAETNSDLRARAGAVQVLSGAMVAKNLAEVMEFGQLMAKAGPMIGKAFRGNPGACVGITMQAMQWGMSPFAVSQKAYVTNDTIAYEAQLVTAVINAHAPVKERPQYEYHGEGATRRCVITATLKGDSKPSIYTSPEFGTITTKNSPLWKQDPDQQLGYYSIRAWARKYCPEIIMGVYAVDEIASVDAINITPADEYDQRQPEEIAEAQEERGAFIMGEAWSLVQEHYAKAFAECERIEDLESIWKSFQRKYWIGKRRCISQNSFDGMEHVADFHRIRFEGEPQILTRVEALIDASADLDELDRRWSDKHTEAMVARLPEASARKVQSLYEAAQERFADAVIAELDAARKSPSPTRAALVASLETEK